MPITVFNLLVQCAHNNNNNNNKENDNNSNNNIIYYAFSVQCHIYTSTNRSENSHEFSPITFHCWPVIGKSKSCFYLNRD